MLKTLPRILCVDDERQVLEGLTLNLRRAFQMETAGSGADGLKIIEEKEPFAVILSDMRMPGMDGATFLANARKASPDSVRVLLTGHSDMEATIRAVNSGQIFRFLTKPCPVDVLLAALKAAVEQHQLIVSERVLLEQTLHGSIKMLTDVLALANPAAFGRASRAKEMVGKMTKKLEVSPTWQVEMAAMLSQIGCITLPPDTVEKLYFGRPLAEDELPMVARLPAIADQLLAHIPRLEEVREILRHMDDRFEGPNAGGLRAESIPIGARILKVALAFDILEASQLTRLQAMAVLIGRHGDNDPRVLKALESLVEDSEQKALVPVKVQDLKEGMVLAADVVTPTGMLLIARGHEVTANLLERIKNFARRQGVKEPLQVTLPRS
jgi:response regulator RpfG family c-di-GMP phosphodiesterase